MNLANAFTVLAHTATQLIGRWMPPPASVSLIDYWDTSIAKKLRMNFIFYQINAEDWEDLLAVDISLPSPALPRLATLIKGKLHLLREIATAADFHLKSASQCGAGILLITDPLYPESLKSIAKPPLMLTYLGDPNSLALPKIAVIGSRQANYFGLYETVNLGAQLAERNVCVVSGGAIGCDIAVHQGMLSSTRDHVFACVVFAGGLSALYPSRHKTIFERILCSGGLLISERLWWQSSRPKDFPIRNRIVSGLSKSVIVMQAGEASGALITADEALEQGRDVYVLEHDQDDIRAAGSQKLIEDGAVAFKSVEELLNLLGWEDCMETNDFMLEGACHNSQKIGTVGIERIIN